MADLDRAQLVRAAAEAREAHDPDGGGFCRCGRGVVWTYRHRDAAAVDAVAALIAEHVADTCDFPYDLPCRCCEPLVDRLRALRVWGAATSPTGEESSNV